MAAPAHAFPGDMQIGEFLGFLKHRPKEEYWQLVEGIAIMMNPPTQVHQVIGLNFRDLLQKAIEIRGLDLLVLNESGLRVPGVANFLPRPDVLVIPGMATYEVYADRFVMVAEVLSPSNTKSLIAQKLRRYEQHPENLYCIVIDSRRTWLQIHARRSGWKPVTFDDPADEVELPEFGLRRALGGLYRHTPLDPGRSPRRDRSRPR
jgi:Uma2 family endonuclease